MIRQYSFLLAFPLIFTLVVLYLMGDAQPAQNSSVTSVNAVIGDESYIQLYGKEPGGDVPDHIRIRVHLDYVEGLLRNRPVAHLAPQQRENRNMYLDLLRDYTLAGEFPYNDGHPDNRRPAFISEDGRICAVGWLIEQTEGRAVAEKINAQFKYAFIPDIDDPLFLEWAEESGFTIEELAMIQPQYGSYVFEEIQQNRNRINASFGIGSALITGSNVLYLSNSPQQPWLFDTPAQNHWFGLAAGSASVMLGVFNIRSRHVYQTPIGAKPCQISCPVTEITETNHLKSGVAAVNLGVGLFSVARAGYHLLNGSKQPDAAPSGFGVSLLIAEPMVSDATVPALTYSLRF